MLSRLMHSITLRVSTRDMETREITDDVGDVASGAFGMVRVGWTVPVRVWG